MKTIRAPARILSALILLTTIVPAAWGGPFTNGGFELPTLPANTWFWLSPGVTSPPGVTNLIGWTVGGSSTGTILVNGIPPPGIGLNPLEGDQQVIFDVDNLPTGGTIAQTFDTEVGRTYAVSFNVGKEEEAPGTMELTATVTSSDGSVLGTLAAPQASLGWGPTNTLVFTATTLSSTLTFMDTSTTTINTDVGLDNVSVQALGPFTNGLIAYYPFNGNANDESGNGNNGVVSGATLTQDQFGRSGMAYAFNGINSFITSNIPNIPTGATPRSISLWAAANPIPSIGQCLACWGAGQYGQAFSIEDNGSPLTWWGGLFGPPPADDLNSGVIVDTNWHHLVFVYDGTNASIAVDGAQKATASRSPNTAFSAFIVGVGMGPGGLSGFFSGSIDDVRIYNRALSTNEVAQLYAIESVPPQSFLTNGLLAYYPLTTDGTDQSGHGLNLTLSNVVFSTVGSAEDMRPAASFDGELSYAIVNQALIADQTNWTWAAWLYSPQGATETSNEQWIYMEGLQSGPCFGIIINDINEPGTLGIAAWNVSSSGNWMHVYVPNVLTNGWNHLVFTLANGNVGSETLSIFFNGVLTNSSVFQSVVPQGTSPIGVIGNGWLHSWLTAPWKGSMADLRFYNRALSSNEVAQLYAIESVPPPGFQTNGLVAYFPFNGNANDASGNGHNGIVSGTLLTTNRFGNANSAYYFNGSSAYITVPLSSSVFSNDFTASVWFNTFDLANAWPTLLDEQGNSPFRLFTSGDSCGCSSPDHLFSYATYPGPSFNWWVSLTNQTTPIGTYCQAVVTKAGGTVTMYFNSQAVASNTVASPTTITGSYLTVGTLDPAVFGPASGGYFHGIIDDIRIYNRALSDSEVQALYAIESTPPSPPPCVAYAATANVIVTNGFVIGATITDGGCGYTNTPVVRIIGGGGSGAEAVAVVTNGIVIAVNVVNAGSGYVNTPVIAIAPPFIPQPTMGIAGLSLLTFTNVAVGTNYQLQSFLGGTLFNVGAAFSATNSTFTQLVSGTVSPNGYRLAVTPVPQQAYATAIVDLGFVIGDTNLIGGSGYTTNPAVTILNDGVGSNATAIAYVSGGSVTNIMITDAGIGYTNGATIIIAPPPANALSPTVTQVMELSFAGLSPYDNYQLQYSPAVNGSWTDFATPFTCTSSTTTQYVNVSGRIGFLRVKYVP